MSSSRHTAIRVLRLRVKDKHAAWLSGLAREVNTVFNYCNELSVKVFERERRFLSGFDFWPFLKGVTRGDCALHLPVQAVQEIAEEYARRRRQHRKVRLAWRKSGGARRSLGWIPFKVRTIRYRGGQIYFAGRWLSLWDSYGLGSVELRAGNFSEDSRGRWYLNVCVPRAQRVGDERNKPSVGSILDRSVPSLGIDLGLKTFAAFSDEAIPPIEAERFYRDLEPALAHAQRARHRNRTRAIHAKIANRRKDFLHKLSTRLVKAYGAISVGNVNASALAKTRQAKSVLDAGWSAFRTMLQYKCADAGVWFAEVDEAFSTQTCSVCDSRAGPKGRKDLGISHHGTTGSRYVAPWITLRIGKEPWRRATYEWEPAMKNVRFIGLDVHAETIAVAVAEPGGEVRSLGTIPNRAESVRRLIGKLGKPESLKVCYEAGPTGYVLYWQLTELGVACEVVAPTLVPVKAGDRVKTDRRDAEKLARCYRSGDLTAVWVPDAAHEALRDLVRARLAAKRDQLRARNRLSKFLMRQGRHAPETATAWTVKYMDWVKQQHFEHAAQEATLVDYLHEVEHVAERIVRLDRDIDAAVERTPETLRAVIAGLQSLRGIAKISAVTLVAELGQLSRFAHPRQLMGYSGAVSREHTSGPLVRRGPISKAGNAHLRRIMTESAWAYRHRPAIGRALAARNREQSEAVKAIAWRAQHRLHARYCALLARNKTKQKVIMAIGRELLGFIWAIGVEIERGHTAQEVKRAA